MKKYVAIFNLILLSVQTILGQNIKVISRVIAVHNPPYVFTNAQFSPTGDKIIFSEPGYKGLWLYDLNQKTLEQLNDYWGAGSNPIFSPDGKRIYFTVDNYKAFRKYTSLAVVEIESKKTNFLIQDQRHFFPITLSENEKFVYRIGKEIKTVATLNKPLPNAMPVNETIGYSDLGKIVIIQNGKRKELQPFGNKHYIWFSLSPDKTKMLFTVAGGSTYICDLDGNPLVDLGKAHAPKWSPDGKWVVYMVDKDDGHQFTASDIWVARSDGSMKINITNTPDEIELYPSWSPNMDKIVFETIDGKIVIINLEIKE